MGFGSLGVGSGAWGSTTLTPPTTPGFGVGFTLTPASANWRGGDEITIQSQTLLDMNACTPDLTDGAFDSGLWTLLGGPVYEVAGGLSMRAGTAAGSTTGIQSTALENDLDISVTAGPSAVTAPSSSTLTLWELALVATSGETVALTVEQTQGVRRVRLGPFVVESQTTGSMTLRLVRVGAKVWAIVGQRAPIEVNFTSTQCRIRVRVLNDATADSTVTTRMTQYVRRPVLAFDGRPMLVLRQLDDQLAVGTVPAADRPKTAVVTLTGCGLSGSGSFEYTLEDDRMRVTHESSGRLITLTDRQLRGKV